MACHGLWPLALSQGSHSYHVVPLHLPLYIQVGLTNMNGGIELGFEIDGNNKVSFYECRRFGCILVTTASKPENSTDSVFAFWPTLTNFGYFGTNVSTFWCTFYRPR